MSDLSKIAVIKELLDTAEKSLSQARKVVADITWDNLNVSPGTFIRAAQDNLKDSPIEQEQDSTEGVFNGQEMVCSDWKTYPVPANYASKSKLVSWDRMKLTVTPDWRFLYKQIGPVPRKYLVWPLTYSDGIYQVLVEGKSYKALLASVTYFKAEIWNDVAIIIPDGIDTEWAAIDAVIPKTQ